MSHRFIFATASLLAASFAGAAPPPLASLAPASTNALVLVDVAGLHDSPIGKTRDWVAKHAEDYRNGVTPFPETSTAVMFAREIDSRGWRGLKREISVVKTQGPVGIATLQKATGGKLQTLGRRKAIATRKGVMATLLDENTVAGHFPADRQAFGRWLSNVDSGSGTGLGSPYLQRCVAAWPSDGQIMIAVDMANGADEAAILEELKTQPKGAPSEADAKKLAAAFARLEGMRLSIKATDRIEAVWSIDFSEPIAASEASLRPYFETAAKRVGEGEIDLSKWKMSMRPAAVVFTHVMSPEEFHSFLGAIHSPMLSGASYARSGAVDPSKSAASHKYFRTVSNLVNALDRNADSTTNYPLAASEYDRVGGRIQRISTDNVDDEVVAWADYVANVLFGISSSLRGVSREAETQAAGAWESRYFVGPTVSSYPGWNYPWRWGYSDPIYEGPNPVSAAREKTYRAIGDAAAQRRDDWLKIREASRAVERKMSDKYGIDFSKK